MYSIPFLDLPALEGASGSIRLPGSKSISNRALLLAALCENQSTVLTGLLVSDDTEAMLAALKQLGCTTSQTPQGLRVSGLERHAMPQQAELHLGNAGTAMRPLTAVLALLAQGPQRYVLSGVARMHERPIGDLVDALRQLGAQIDCLCNPGYPPLAIGGRQAPASGNGAQQAPIRVRGDVSSQFLTALLMALPLACASESRVIEVQGTLISRPYIAITLELMARFGVRVGNDNWQRFTVEAGSRYRSPGVLQIEPDASSASYFIALGAIAGSGSEAIVIEGLGSDSIQGDIRFLEAARQMGAEIQAQPDRLVVRRGCWPLRAIDIDANHIPDAAMTLAVMALYADGTTRLGNIGSWRVKETDRIEAMASELTRLGARVACGPDWLEVTPPPAGGWQAASVATYDDHRMAMCLALAAFNPAGLPVRIQEPRCVGKTFPDYFETLFKVARAKPDRLPVICIDGPSASGKGTLAQAVAERLGFGALDSGALYRVAALAASRQALPIDAAHAQELAALALHLPLRFEGERVLLDGDDVSDEIRSARVSHDASVISAIPAVRDALLGWQRAAVRLPGLVADGRDMGTVVFPQAALKVFLTASVEKRAQRRHKQLISKGNKATLCNLRDELEARDARDANRAVAPTRPAADALMLDNTEMSVEAAVAQVLEWWQQRQPF